MTAQFNDFTIYDGSYYYTPFVDVDGRVGYRIGDADRPDLETFLYFNPSSTHYNNGQDTPNVFVYLGTENDPAYDESLHFYNIDNEAFGLEEE